MTLKEFNDFLTRYTKAYPERAEHNVLVSRDPEGNGYSPISKIMGIGFVNGTNYNDIYDDEEIEVETAEDNGYKPVIVLYPIS